MARLFTLQEAEALLPAVERWLRSAIDSKNDASRLETEINALLLRVNLLGGVQIDISAAAQMKSGRQQALERLKQALTEIEEAGVLVKDLDIGLIDFPTLLDDDEVYLCWKLGEPRIGFWHGTTEGYQGRKPVDDDFLKRHKGGRLH